AVTTAFATALSLQQRHLLTTTGTNGASAKEAGMASRRPTPRFSVSPHTDPAMTTTTATTTTMAETMAATTGPARDALARLTSRRHRDRGEATVATAAAKLRGGEGLTAGHDFAMRFGRRLFGPGASSGSSGSDRGNPETSNGGSGPPGTGGMG
ncbi:unnamed protein product, partial [Laminaria digitata]